MAQIIRKHWSIFSKIFFLAFFFVVIAFSSKIFFFKTLPAKGSWLATSTWVGAAAGNWQNAANWSNGIPTSTMLADISSSSAITITATGTIDFDTLRVGGGAASSTLILVGNIGAGIDINIKNNGKISQSSTVQQTISGTLLIESGGTLTHTANTSTQARILNFNANTITLNSGGIITATGVGYAGNNVIGETGKGPGGGQSSGSLTAAGGGGHGGNGGDESTTILGGQGYCDVTNLNTMGSGGGGSSSFPGTAGGGLIILSATGTITLNGTITANGTNGTTFIASGGAGGGIKLTADIIAGTPSSFTALGGNGDNGNSGGGGCVFIGYTTSNTITPTSSYFSINGGTTGVDGSGGMALIKQASANGGLYVLNGTLAAAVTQPSSTVSAITADFIYVSSTVFQVTSSKTFTLANSSPFLGNNKGEIRVYGRMVPSAGVFSSINSTTLTIEAGGSVAVSSTFTASSSLNLYKGFVGIATDTFSNLIIQTGTTTAYNFTTSSAIGLSNLTVNGGFLTHGANSSTQDHVLNIAATSSITINAGGTVTASGTGYLGGSDGNGLGQGPGGASSSLNNQGAGGGHGGNGSDDSTSIGGQGYCDITNVSTIGSGGSGSQSSEGGNGGGLIILSATGTITINGTVLAGGSVGGNSSAGGGAGGGIRITADIITGTPIRFSASGGSGGSSSVGGGGGCVNIFYTTSNTITPTSSYFSVYGGTPTTGQGSGGMALVKQLGVNNGGLYVLNSGLATAITQPSSSVPAITADFIYVSSTVFQITSTKIFTLVNSDPFSGNRLGEIRVYGTLSTSTGFSAVNNIAISVFAGGIMTASSTVNLGVSTTLKLTTSSILSGNVINLNSSGTLHIYNSAVISSTASLSVNSGTTTFFSFTTSSPFYLANLTINSGGSITHATNTTAQNHVLNISVSSSITINSGGRINVNEIGYSGGAASNGTGLGPGGGRGGVAVGGGHGGDGGNATTSGWGYCDITNINTIGSGGGSNSGADGGAGGGLVVLSATGTITISGIITANGALGESNSASGGSGGGIKITAGVIAGTPSLLSASGGNAKTSGSSDGGSGGGGCVNIFYTTSNTITPTSSYFFINGGTTAVRGSGGMALVKQIGVNNGGLYVLNNGFATSSVTQPTSTVPAITADFIYVSSTIFQVTSSKTLTLVNEDPFSGNGLGEIRVYGSMVKSVGVFDNINDIALTIESGASVSVSSTFTASSSLNLYRGFIGITANTFTNLIIQSGTTTVYDYNTSTVPLSLRTLTINSSSVLTHATNTAAQSNILYVVASSTITINAGASVVSNGAGYEGGATNVPGSGPGYGSSTASKGGGGGAHGGNGGDGASSGGLGGTAYCSSTNPITIGSGGGGGSGQAGASAGGLIWLSATSTITVSGHIKANGNSTTASGGGGAGGGIKIIASTVAGTPQSFTANGGNGGTTGGGGGGGCIYIQYTVSNSVTSTLATSTFGTGGTGIDGTAGTFQTSQLSPASTAPTVTAIFPYQTSTSIVLVTTTIADTDLNTTSLTVLYSTDGTTWVSSTIASVSQGGAGNGVSTSTGLISGIDTDGSGSINLTFEWNAGVDIPSTEDTTVYIKITPSNGIADGTAVSSTAFAVDTKAPTAPGNLVLFNTSTQSATLTFGSASVETNFVQYIIFYKAGSSGVAITDTAFTSTSDSNLGFINYNTATSTTISALATSTQYVFNIWAYDGFSYTPAASEITFYTLANTSSAPTLSNQTTTTLDIAITSGDTNPATVEYAIQETSSTNYVQTNGTLGASAAWATRSSWGTKTITGLSANTPYTFRVKARNGNNVETTFSATSSIISLANNVTTLVAANSTITSTYRVDLSWTNAGQTGMKLERDNACDGIYDATLFDSSSANDSSPTTTLSSLQANTCYRFRISSYNSAGTLNSTNIAVSNDITMPPAAPVNVTVVSVSTSSITWGWDAVSGATTYYVYNTSLVLVDTVSITSSIQTGLTVSTSYSIFVRAANSNGTGVSSSVATAVTGPAAPAGLAANSRTTSTITWGWTNGGQYQFFAQDKNNTADNSGWITDITWLQSSLIANTAYTLQVKARDVSSTESGFTEITRYTSQNFPTSITFTTTTASAITLVINGSFINLGSGSSLIHIDNGVGVTQDLTNTTTWQNTSLNAGVQYTYTTYAVNGDGDLTASTTGSKYTLAATPAAPTVFNPTSSTLVIAITAGDSNSVTVEYAIQETGSGNYVQSDGTLGASAFWAVTSTWGSKTVTGLSVNTQYIFKAKARNGESTETAFGSIASLYTYANIPGIPTLGSSTTSSLSVTIDTNNNPSYTTYSIYNNTANNYGAADGSPVSNPVWQTSSTWGSNYFATGLSPNTSYNFSVIARNGDDVATATSTSSSAKYTLASVPSSVAAVADSKTQITLSWSGSATSSYAENITASTTSGWISATSYAFSGLTCGTSYSFRVKAINADGVETDFSSSVIVQTNSCVDAAVPSSGGGTAFPVTVSPPVVVQPVQPVEPEPEVIPTVTTTEDIPPNVLPPKEIPIVIITSTIKVITKIVTSTPEKIVILPVRIVVSNVVNGPQQVVAGSAPTSVVVVSADQPVVSKAPLSLRGLWEYLDPAMLKRFVFAPLPEDVLAFWSKFPKIQSIMSQIGVVRFSDVEKIKSASIYLPTLNKTMGLNQATVLTDKFGVSTVIPLEKISQLLKNKIPVNIIFAQTAQYLVDIRTALSFNEKSHPEQTINTISGKPLQLTIRPDHPVSRVRGYLFYIPKITQAKKSQGVAFSIKNLFVEPASASVDEPVEKKLVVLEFEYTDPDKDGIYTANITSPIPAGQYKILTIMDYEDPNLGSRQVELIAVVDPEGRVYENVNGRQLLVSGAVVTIFYLDPATQKYEVWRAKDFLQSNPLTTDAKGVYSFLVPDGSYYLKAEAPGYLVYESKPFIVEQGGGVHMDLELKPKYWGLKILDWKTMIIVMFAIFLGYFIYKEKKLEKKEKVLEELLEKK